MAELGLIWAVLGDAMSWTISTAPLQMIQGLSFVILDEDGAMYYCIVYNSPKQVRLDFSLGWLEENIPRLAIFR